MEQVIATKTEINFTVSNGKGALILILNSNVKPEKYDIEETKHKGVILADWLNKNAPYHLVKGMFNELRKEGIYNAGDRE